jgi:hypothetical protein
MPEIATVLHHDGGGAGATSAAKAGPAQNPKQRLSASVAPSGDARKGTDGIGRYLLALWSMCRWSIFRSNPLYLSDKNMLQLLNLERFLVDRVNSPGGQAL